MKTEATNFLTMLREAIEQHDAPAVGELVDILRFQCRANYEQCYSVARELTGIAPDAWDELLYEADQAIALTEPGQREKTTGGW